MDTLIITFKTNQSIIGQVDCTKENKVKIKKPVQIYSQMGKDGQAMMGFAPFLEFSEEFKTGIEFDMDNVLCITTPIKDVVNQYSKIFGSGIQMATPEELQAIRKAT